MINAHLLLVDRDADSLCALLRHFEAEPDLTLRTARSVQEAWAILQDPAEQFDLMILDSLMPGREGFALSRSIRADSRLAAIPVVLQTAGTPSAEQVRTGAAAGVYHFLTMPCTHDAVVAIVNAALAKSSFRNALRRQLRSHAGEGHRLDNCEFSIRTLDEAGQLATRIARACPNADAALFGISELLVNSVEHGNLGLSYADKSLLALNNRWRSEVERRGALPENLGKQVSLIFQREAERITLRITDEGSGFAWRDFLELDPRRACDPNGRGIALARKISFSSIYYEGDGNIAVATISPENWD